MQRQILLLTLILSTVFGYSQKLDGTYFSLELNGLKVDTSGRVDFFMKDSFPVQKWFHRVEVSIKGTDIVITKTPVHTNITGKMWHSASDGGFLTYKGKITKTAGIYIAETHLSDYDYLGFSIFQPPVISNYIDSILSKKSQHNDTHLTAAELKKRYDVTKGVNGVEVFLPKGTSRQDFVIRSEEEGLRINNVFYYKLK